MYYRIIRDCLRVREGDIMARFWASLIINKEKKFSETPRQLKVKVEKILIDEGYEDLIIY